MVIFYCAAGAGIGLGHFNRCLKISKALEKNYPMIHSCFVAPSPAMKKNNMRFLEKWEDVLPGQVFVLDRVTTQCIEDPTALCQLLKEISARQHKIVFIDGVGSHCFLSKQDNLPEIDLAVIPYAGAQPIAHARVKNWLMGSYYALIDEIYQSAQKRPQPLHCRKVLVTLGGADPKNLTMLVLKALSQLDVICRIIVGPFFSKESINQIKRFASKKPSWEVVFSPPTLFEYYDWADLVVNSIGVSSYEVMAMGKPSLQISSSMAHAEHGDYLDKHQLICHIGYFGGVAQNELSTKIASLLENQQQREMLSNNAYNAINSKGVLHVANAIGQLDQSIA